MTVYRQPVVFFAIPCGEFYSLQTDIIGRVCARAGVTCQIAEDDVKTKELWTKIAQGIKEADRFVADISSGSFNIALELGFALQVKGDRNVAIFNSNVASDPSDLRGFVLQKYGTLREFEERLALWLSDTFPLVDAVTPAAPSIPAPTFTEEFRDPELFQRRWSVPPGGGYLLRPEGLKFGFANYPIMTTSLALLQNCDFEFTGRIDEKQIGWAIKGTKYPENMVPIFCLMFTLNTEGELTPHILSLASPGPARSYYPYRKEAVQTNVTKREGGWFTLITRIREDRVQIENEGNLLFDADFSEKPYSEAYSSVNPKHGQVGFRCFPSEVATVSRVVVREAV